MPPAGAHEDSWLPETPQPLLLAPARPSAQRAPESRSLASPPGQLPPTLTWAASWARRSWARQSWAAPGACSKRPSKTHSWAWARISCSSMESEAGLMSGLGACEKFSLRRLKAPAGETGLRGAAQPSP